MPELPEVETVRRGLSEVMNGRVLREVILRRPDLRRPFPENFVVRLEGRRIGVLSRRAKYLIMPLDDGWNVLIHLGMSGSMAIIDENDVSGERQAGRHDHVEFATDGGKRIVYRDPRRFGLMDMCAASDMGTHPLLRTLGPEPLDENFTADVLEAALSGRSSPIKTVLLDQTVVAGLGNIYVCESLHSAGISPFRPAASLSGREIERLVLAVREVLSRAVEAGGSTLRDHRQPDGTLGYFQHMFAVYDREGEACPLCRDRNDAVISRAVQSGRSTFYCSRHQL